MGIGLKVYWSTRILAGTNRCEEAPWAVLSAVLLVAITMLLQQHEQSLRTVVALPRRHQCTPPPTLTTPTAIIPTEITIVATLTVWEEEEAVEEEEEEEEEETILTSQAITSPTNISLAGKCRATREGSLAGQEGSDPRRRYLGEVSSICPLEG
jgi:hypothetical protein